MTYGIRVYETGRPEVLQWAAVDVGTPGPGEVRLRHTAIGCNFADIYYRSGLYPTPLPFTPGREGVGVVEQVGAGVTELAPGNRVGYASVSGSYCQERLIQAERLVRLPPFVDDHTATAALLRGMTARCLLKDVYPVSAADTVLVQAAAGGVGLLLCQWASAIGATVIGTVSTEEKATLARANGCHHTIAYTQEGVSARVEEITGGRGVSVVYDSVGRDTFTDSLNCLAPLGLMVLFGQSSGLVPPLDIGELAMRGSLSITRPMLPAYIPSPTRLKTVANDVFAALERGILQVTACQSYPLEHADRAHRDLEARHTIGSTILVV